MPIYHVTKHLETTFDTIMVKLDRARKDDKRLKLLLQADALLRQNQYGWDAVHLRPGKLYRARARSRIHDTNGVDHVAPLAAPVAPVAPPSQVDVHARARTIKMSHETRPQLRSVLRRHPDFKAYRDNTMKGKILQSWNKIELVRAAMTFGIDLDWIFPPDTTVVSQPEQLELEDAIANAKATAPVPVAPEVTDTDPESIECKGYAVELSERDSVNINDRIYFRLIAKLSRSLYAVERDRIIEVYTTPSTQQGVQ
jgi:hypothetical protein